MESLFVSKAEFTPMFHYDVELHRLEVAGFSRPEDVRGFYHPLFSWFESHKEAIQSRLLSLTKLTVVFKLTYFNSASSKCILDIVLLLNSIYRNRIVVEWHYEEEDEDMLESGQELSEAVEIPFEYIEDKEC